jgi:translocation and assembly module TamB
VIAGSIKYAVLLLAVILLAVVLSGLWLIETESGSRWLWNRAVSAIPGELSSETTSGSVGGGLHLTNVSYVSDAVDVDIAEATIAARLVLFPLSIDIRELRARHVDIRLKETDTADEPDQPILERLSLPFELKLEDAAVRDLEIRSSAGERLFAADNASLAGRWHDEILLTRLSVESDLGSIDGAARLALAKPHDAAASFAAVIPLAVGDDPAYPLQVRAEVEGRLDLLQIEVSSQEPAVHVVGRLLNLTESPGWEARVESPFFQWPLDAGMDEPPQVYLKNADLKTAGDLSNYSISGTGVVAVAGTEELSFKLDADGSLDGLAVSGLQLQGDMLAATALGELRWSDGFAVAVDADVEHFDAAALTERWPVGQPVSGTVDAGWTAGNLRLNEVRLRVRDTSAGVDAAGEIDIDGGVVDLDLDWRDLQWPLPGTEQREDDSPARFSSEFGSVSVSGTPDNWKFDGRAAFKANTLPQGVFVLTGNGNREKVEAILEGSDVLGGSASGKGSYNWADHGQWSAALRTENLDIGPLVPELPGRLSSDFTARGRMDPPQFAVDISRLEGVVRDQPLAGEGGIRYVDGNFSARQLRITSGESELRADGSLTSEPGLEFALDVDALETFHPDVAGSLQVDGNLSLSGEFPSLRIDLEGRELYWGDYALQELRVTSGAGESGLPLSLDARGTSLTVGTREMQAFSAELDAGPERQRLVVSLTPEEHDFRLELDGGLGDWRRPFDSVWTGTLLAIEFEAPEGDGFSLVEPADLKLSGSLLSLERACLSGGAGGRVCLEADWTGKRNFELGAEMDAVPVHLVDLVFETNLEFTQTLSGSLLIGSDADQSISGTGQIDISPGRIRNRLDSRLATQTGAGELHFDLADGQLLSGSLTLPFSDSAEIDARFRAEDIGSGADSPVDGQLRVNLNDIAVAANVLPEFDEARGRLDIDLAIGGTLGSPLFTGEASLRNGALRYEPLGLRLTEIQLTSTIREDNRIDLQSTFRAGDGVGELQSSAGSLEAIRDGLELTLIGENLTLIDLPDINVVADPDLIVGLQDGGLTINGNILIPRARVTPVDLTSGDKISESEDVVIVSNEGDEDVEATNDNSAPFAIHGTVALVLGPDVVVDLDVAEARVTGTSAFHWTGPHMPVANGQYQIEGRVQAYGQLLDITEGTIRFPGVPASSPNLRIRAEREIFGNPQIRSAGVLVTGTPQEPQIEVYTNPETSRDRALTLLVTGSDFNYEQGVGAVDVGTYIAPDLYISYGIGLFERGNVISIRYDIAKGFGIKATSGRNAEGVDLSYTLER